jgi:hypothetical protein
LFFSATNSPLIVQAIANADLYKSITTLVVFFFLLISNLNYKVIRIIPIIMDFFNISLFKVKSILL